MPDFRGTLLVTLCAVFLCAQSSAQDARRSEMRSLDEQVQEIKSDVLGIAKDLSLLEERLLYPSNTQIAVFVAMAQESQFRLDAVQLQIDGELVTHFIYGFKELEALQSGGVQRVFTGNVSTGRHELNVSVNGKREGGEEFTSSQTFSFNKNIDPKLLGLMLTAEAGGASIELGDW